MHPKNFQAKMRCASMHQWPSSTLGKLYAAAAFHAYPSIPRQLTSNATIIVCALVSIVFPLFHFKLEFLLGHPVNVILPLNLFESVDSAGNRTSGNNLSNE